MFSAIRQTLCHIRARRVWEYIREHLQNDDLLHHGIVTLLERDCIAVKLWLANLAFLWYGSTSVVRISSDLLPIYLHFQRRRRFGSRMDMVLHPTPSVSRLSSALRPTFPTWFIAGYPDVTAWYRTLLTDAQMTPAQSLKDVVAEECEALLKELEQTHTDLYGSVHNVPHRREQERITFLRALTVSYQEHTGLGLECATVLT